jgi:hypothetical protein
MIMDSLVETVETLVAKAVVERGDLEMVATEMVVMGTVDSVVVMEVVMEGVTEGVIEADSVQEEIAAARCSPSSLSRQRRRRGRRSPPRADWRGARIAARQCAPTSCL